MAKYFLYIFILLFLSVIGNSQIDSLTDNEKILQLDVSNDSVSTSTVNSYFSFYVHGPTQKFYHFTAQNAVLAIVLRCEMGIAYMKASVHIFDPKETSDIIYKWINNRWADAIYGDAPSPILSYVIPEDMIRIHPPYLVSHVFDHNANKYDIYQVGFYIKEISVHDAFRLNEFYDQIDVYEIKREIEQK